MSLAGTFVLFHCDLIIAPTWGPGDRRRVAFSHGGDGHMTLRWVWTGALDYVIEQGGIPLVYWPYVTADNPPQSHALWSGKIAEGDIFYAPWALGCNPPGKTWQDRLNTARKRVCDRIGVPLDFDPEPLVPGRCFRRHLAERYEHVLLAEPFVQMLRDT